MSSVVPSPARLTDQEAATLPIAALTPWYAMREYGDIGAFGKIVVAVG